MDGGSAVPRGCAGNGFEEVDRRGSGGAAPGQQGRVEAVALWLPGRYGLRDGFEDRALPALRQAVGRRGAVIAIDVTPEMLHQAHPKCQAARAALVLADARRLPLADASADAVFAAGLVNHLPDAESGLGELARVTRRGGRLVLFHPSGRAALAARHGRAPTPDEPLAEGPLLRSTRAAGWRLTGYDDTADRFFAVAVRR